MENVMP